MPFPIKQGDTRPKKVDQLVDNFGNTALQAPINLTTATSVKFIMAPKGGGAVKVNALGEIEDAADGMVSYDWDPEDTDTIGIFECEWQILWSDGGIESVPNNGFIEVQVYADLGD